MHSVCYLAVTADDLDGALAAAVDFLEPYQERVYDYYAIGGRWSGSLGGDDAVCAAGGRRAFLDAVERGRAWVDETYHQARQDLHGPDPRFPAVNRVDSDDDQVYEEMVQRTWSRYRATSERFTALLRAEVMPESGDHLLAYRLRRYADLLAGTFSTDCSFYDTVERTTRVEAVLARVDEDPDRQWLVVVDLHS